MFMQDKIISPRNFFRKVIQQAFKDCRIQTYKMVPIYLEGLLQKYIETNKLYDIVDEKGNKKRETLAEIYLKAFSSHTSLKERKTLLKKIGDTSLYVSGFFGDSLKRKVIDLNYYIDMGKASYKHLADYTEEDTFSLVFMEFANRFKDFVGALTYISQKGQSKILHLNLKRKVQ